MAMGKGDFYSFDNAGAVTNTKTYGTNEIVKSYNNLEPRISASYVMNPTTSIKAGYARNTQNLHLISNSTSTTPTDLWIASSANTKPEISDQVSVGYYKNLNENNYEFSSEVYYKNMQNQIDYRNGANTQANDKIEGELLYGTGRAYGIELFLKKKTGRFNGWIGYTLSKTERQINGINENNWYNAKQDRTHDASIVGIYEWNNRWTLSGTFVYNTGNAVTFPSGKYIVDNQVNFLYSERNGYRMPDNHRLDLGATNTKTFANGRERQWSFSLYNAYGRQNAYIIQFKEDPNDKTKTIAEQTSLFRWIPSISYNFKF
jgi:TonB dependent receptor